MSGFEEKYLVRLLMVLATAGLCVLQLAVFIPLQLYLGNADDFSSGSLNILEHLLAPGMISLLVFSLLVAAFKGTPFRIVIASLVSLNMCLYVQSELLVWKTGQFTGNEIDWDAFQYREWTDYACWFSFFMLALIACRKLASNALLISALLFATQTVASITASANFSGAWITPRAAPGLADFYRFSSTRNIIFIILDTFESPAFNFIVEQDPKYKEWFRGFTYYRNTVGPFPTTLPSIPAILSGVIYDNSEPIKEYMAEVLPKQSLPSVLHRAGYQVDLTTLSHYCSHLPASDSCISLDAAVSGDLDKVEQSEAAKLFDLVLFRSLPGYGKKWVFNEHKWRLQQKFQRRKGPMQHVQSIEFLDTLKRQAHVAPGPPTFKFLHLMVPHLPLRLDAECNYSDKYKQVKVRDYSMQARCALKLSDAIIEVLKQIGVFDQSLIAILGDHGFTLKFFSPDAGANIFKALPLLLVKMPQSNEPMQVSNVPAMVSDLPASITDVLSLPDSFPGRSIFRLSQDEARERRFFNYKWQNDNWAKAYLPPLKEYVVRGDAWQGPSWKLERTIPPGE